MRMLTSSMILCLGAATLFAQDDIQRGRVKSLDRDKSTITLIVGDKERVYLVTTETRTEAGPKGDGELPGIKEGIEVNFKATTQDGKEVLVGIRPIEPARGGIQQGRVKKLDLEAAKIVIESDGKERILSITPETKVVEGDRESKERLPGVKEGVAVQFVTATRDGKEILVAIRVGGGQPAASQPLFDHSKLKALTEMGTEK